MRRLIDLYVTVGNSDRTPDAVAALMVLGPILATLLVLIAGLGAIATRP